MLNQNVLLIHDIDPDSGFQGDNAQKYKIKKEKLLKILSYLKIDSIILTFDDGGHSINNEFLSSLSDLYEIHVFIPTAYINKPGFLTSNEIIKLSKSNINIGSHSHSHKDNLKEFSNKDYKQDWFLSKNILEELIKKEVNTCSIPFGKYKKKHLLFLKDIGFNKIMTSDPTNSSRFNIVPRIAIDNRFFKIEFIALKVLGIKYLIYRVVLFKFLKKII